MGINFSPTLFIKTDILWYYQASPFGHVYQVRTLLYQGVIVLTQDFAVTLTKSPEPIWLKCEKFGLGQL